MADDGNVEPLTPSQLPTTTSRGIENPAVRSRAHQSTNRWIQAPIDEPTFVNLLEALLPSVVTAAMQTTAISATRSAYSTRDAPRSVFASTDRAASCSWPVPGVHHSGARRDLTGVWSAWERASDGPACL